MIMANNIATTAAAESVSVSDVYLRKLLLECVLSDGAVSVDAFKEWEKLIVFDNLDTQSFLLLPLVYLKLLENKIEGGKFFLRIKSIYRRTWTENQILSKHLNQLFRLFEKAELPFVIASDELTLINLYNDFGAFSLQGFLIFAPFQNKKEFLQSLAESGWTTSFDESKKTELRLNNLFVIEINWKTRAEFFNRRKRANRKSFFGLRVLMLEPEEQLINLCAAEFSPFRENNIHRQIVPGSLFNKRQIDAEKLIAYARERRLSAQAAEMLQDLMSVFGIKIPKEIVHALKQNQNNDGLNLLRQKIRQIQKDYRDAAEYRKHRFSVGGFIEFLSERWKVDSLGRLVIRGARSALKISRAKNTKPQIYTDKSERGEN